MPGAAQRCQNQFSDLILSNRLIRFRINAFGDEFGFIYVEARTVQ